MSEFAHLGTAPGESWDDWQVENAERAEGLVRLRRERDPTYGDVATELELGEDEPAIADVDVDDCGDVYLLRADGRIQRLAPEGPRRIHCEGFDAGDGEPRALDVGTDTIHVGVASSGSDADDGTAGGHIVGISREGRQLRWRTAIPDGTPVRIAADGDVRYALLSAVDGGSLVRVSPGGGLGPVVDSYHDPRDLVVTDGVATVLDATGRGTVLRRSETADLEPGAPASAPDAWGPTLSEHVVALAGEGEGAVLAGRAQPGLDESTLLRVRAEAVSEVVPLPDGVAALELADLLFVLAEEGRELHALAPARRFARNGRSDRYDARLQRRFDAGERAVQWHRVTLGFSRPAPETQVRLSYVAADGPDPPPSPEWSTVEPANPHDALLEDARGRYLWLRIELSGTERTSPTLAACRAYFPRQSYLRHLPAIYREDPESGEFLERFLSIFESTFVDATEEVDAITRYLHPDGIPPAYLEWLERWLALSADETWPVAARRELLEMTPRLFRERGTPAGLLALLGHYVGHVEDPPTGWTELRDRQVTAAEDRAGAEGSPDDAGAVRRRIESPVSLLEYPDLDCAAPAAREPLARLLDCPQCFFAFVGPHVSEEELETVQRLVDEHRPAHAVGSAVQLDPAIVLGGHAYLGENTVLADRDLVVGEGELGRDSVLDEREPHGQLAVRSRLGHDTTLS